MAAYQSISAEQAHQVMGERPEAKVIDVRPTAMYGGAHIPGALSLPIVQLAASAPVALPDKDAPVLVYCQTGVQSKKAAALLAEQGYSDVREFGGIIDWHYDLESSPDALDMDE